MGIFDFLTGEFIDVIHWTDDTRDTMVWRFDRAGHEIKYGAKLTGRADQAAALVHEGQMADVFTLGLYMHETSTMPVMTTLRHRDHGFRSPFESEIGAPTARSPWTRSARSCATSSCRNSAA